MEIHQFFISLAQAIIGIGGTVLTILAPLVYKLIKRFLLQKLDVAENQAELKARELFTNFSKETYFAVEQLAKQGLIDTSKKDMFDKIFKQNFPNVSQEFIDLYREAIVGKVNAEKAKAPIAFGVETAIDPNQSKEIAEQIAKTANIISKDVQ